MKRTQIPSDEVVQLKNNELFGSVGAHRIPVTCDSGADISVVPEECVDENQFTGDSCDIDSFNRQRSTGKLCDVVISVNSRQFKRRAVTQPGKDLVWSVCLSMPFDNREEWDFITTQMSNKFQLKEADTMYLPPEIKDGILKLGFLVSEGVLVPCSNNNEPLHQTSEQLVISESPVTSVQSEQKSDEIGVDDVGDEMSGNSVEKGELDVQPSEVVEEGGDSLGGSAEAEGSQDISIEGIRDDIPKSQLAEATLADISLGPLRKQAQLGKEVYHMENSILFRSRLDPFGQVRQQICLPAPYRGRCMKLGHNNFGHQGRNKMVELIKPFFHWLTMTKDCLRYIKACDTCQCMDKSLPRHNEMQIREMTTVPFERVAVDLVGPFPTAVGGFKFMLTCIDMATRWPEAIPLRTTTAKVIINQLTNIFSRCGFPTVLISDNGTQFTGNIFQKWLKQTCIKYVRASPYHPQGNGVVERLHRTLNSIVS